ncbi:MAG: FkbM family methyltransferase [Luteolibacter sp.]
MVQTSQSTSHDPQSGKLLETSQEQWCQGDWTGLCQLDRTLLEHHPDRCSLSLLAMAAHHQLGHRDETLLWARQARDWGIDGGDLAKILVAGVHNTLGCCAALLGDDSRMTAHFQDAVSCPAVPQSPLASHDRTFRELTRLGLLQEAATLADRQITSLHQQAGPGSNLETHVTILKSEMSLLHDELSLAQRRGQLRNGITLENQPPTSLQEAQTHWLAELRKRASSQIEQDLWVLEKTSYKRGGYFVEFGATNGILLSNTYLLEKEFGWHGLCAEPNPTFFDELKKNRLCTVTNACIGAVSGELVEFIFAEVYGGMARDADSDNHKAKREAYRETGDTAILTTISLHDFLKAHDAPVTIDYLSIDTEGSEFSILEKFPFDQWDVRLLTIEHNFTEQRKSIRNLLESHGYLCQEAQWDDWYYKSDS